MNYYKKNGRLNISAICADSGVNYQCVKRALEAGISEDDMDGIRAYRDSHRERTEASRKKHRAEANPYREIIELRKKGLSLLEIVATTGKSKKTVRKAVRDAGLGGSIRKNQNTIEKTAARLMQLEYREQVKQLSELDLMWARHPIAESEKQRLRYHRTKTPEKMKAQAIRQRRTHRNIMRDPDKRQKFLSRRNRYRKEWRGRPQNKIRINLSARVWLAAKKKGGIKSDSISELIGCSISHFMQRMESMFIGCMSWENYGRAWHVDHIVPCSYFDLTNPEEQRRCFHWTNLRPLWAMTNCKRSDQVGHAQPQFALNG